MRFPKHKGTHSVLLWRTLLFIFFFFFYHGGLKPLDIGQFLGQKPTETSNKKKKTSGFAQWKLCDVPPVFWPWVLSERTTAAGCVKKSRQCQRFVPFSVSVVFLSVCGCCQGHTDNVTSFHHSSSVTRIYTDRAEQDRAMSDYGNIMTKKKKGKLHTSCCTEHLCIIPETGKIETGKIDFKQFS